MVGRSVKLNGEPFEVISILPRGTRVYSTFYNVVYSPTDTGVSPRGIPGFGHGLVCVDSDEHDEQGHITEDLAVRRAGDRKYRLGILIDSAEHYQNPNVLERYLLKPAVLNAFGWRSILVLSKDWDRDPEMVLSRLERQLAAPSGP